ncbi:MAG: glycosyltransferase [Pseudobutyrivibrio sp.]|nr:glycosyltransferase [Pseudobutyrivibrio sp.]
MRILYLDWPCFGQAGLKLLFLRREYEVCAFFHKDYKKWESEEFLAEGEKCFENKNYDIAFSYNYFPLMAELCYRHNLVYISFMYDNPQRLLYSPAVKYSTNRIFSFDSAMVDELKKIGIEHIYYMPLPVDCSNRDVMLQKPYNRERYKSEVSFIGSMYDEPMHLAKVLEGLPSKTIGYVEGVLQAQSSIWGCNFLEDCLTPEIVEEMNKLSGLEPLGMESVEYIYANYYMARKLTSYERHRVLTKLSRISQVKVWTYNKEEVIGNCINCGKADYYKDMPYVIANSKINMNISLRSIKNGIPLRCMDVLGMGGFLLTNFQSDFFKHFVPGEEFVFYADEEDMLDKVEYYLSHERERKMIAEAGFEKVKKNHNFDVIWDALLDVALQRQ